MSDEKELLPCPFCGAPANVLNIPREPSYYVECSDCKATSAIVTACGDEPRPALVARWNKRHNVRANRPSGAEQE